MGCAGGAIPGGLAGGPSGALAGCASGAYIAARARAAGEVINLAVGEQFAKGVSWVQDQAFDSIKNSYPSISDRDAINLVNLGILGITEFGPEIKGFAKNASSGTLSAIKSFKDASGPKFAFADGFDAQKPLSFDFKFDDASKKDIFKFEAGDSKFKIADSDKVHIKASNLRKTPGVATIDSGAFQIVKEGDTWLKGTHANAGKIPEHIAEKMVGREFKNFDNFRKTFWKHVANDDILNKGFDALNLNRIKKGLAPLTYYGEQQVGKVRSYQLHHVNPIRNGGGVYDMNNIIITTPAYHSQFHVNKTKQKSEK